MPTKAEEQQSLEQKVHTSFSIEVPSERVSGEVPLNVQATDKNIAYVLWKIGNIARKAFPPSFRLTVPVGTLPQQLPIQAVAYDKSNKVLYRDKALLNPGARATVFDIVSPKHGEYLSGTVPVRVRASSADSVESIILTYNEQNTPMSKVSKDAYMAHVQVTENTPAFIGVEMKTSRKTYQKMVMLNTVGEVLDVEGIEQLVNVVDKEGGVVKGLTAKDFTVRDPDSKKTYDVTSAQLITDMPMTYIMVNDLSGSVPSKGNTQGYTLVDEEMSGADLHARVAEKFVETIMRKGDKVSVRGFAHFTRELLYSGDRDAVRDKLKQIASARFAGSVVYDAITDALYSAQGDEKRFAVILFTDGLDVDSETTEEQVLFYAKQLGVPIYSFSAITHLKDGQNNPVRTVVNDKFLKQLAQNSGGKHFTFSSTQQLDDAWEKMREDLQTKYLLAYSFSPKQTGQFHKIQIEAKEGMVKYTPVIFR